MNEIFFSASLTTGDDAFQDGRHTAELAAILRNLARQIEDGAEGEFSLRDTNGNGCGCAFLGVKEGDA
jgi:hypothetical protein